MIRSAIQLIWGVDVQTYVIGIRFPMEFGLFKIAPRQVTIVLVTAALVVALHLFLTRTRLGKAMRAISDDADLARVSGIDTEQVIRWTWIIGAGLAAAGGVFIGIDTKVHPSLGWNLLLPLFAAAILGGIGRPYGAIVGGLVIGMVEELSTYPWFRRRALHRSGLQDRRRLLGHGGAADLAAAGPAQGEGALMEADLGLPPLPRSRSLTVGGIYAVLCLGLNVNGAWAACSMSASPASSRSAPTLGRILTRRPAPSISAASTARCRSAWSPRWSLAARRPGRSAASASGCKSDYLAMASIGIAEDPAPRHRERGLADQRHASASPASRGRSTGCRRPVDEHRLACVW